LLRRDRRKRRLWRKKERPRRPFQGAIMGPRSTSSRGRRVPIVAPRGHAPRRAHHALDRVGHSDGRRAIRGDLRDQGAREERRALALAADPGAGVACALLACGAETGALAFVARGEPDDRWIAWPYQLPIVLVAAIAIVTSPWQAAHGAVARVPRCALWNLIGRFSSNGSADNLRLPDPASRYDGSEK